MRFIALSWPLVPSLLLSALVHTVDRDVASVGALASAPVVLSVIVWSLPLLAVAYLCLTVLLRWGVVGFSVATFLFSGLLGWTLAAFGSTATTPAGFAWSLAGSALLFALCLCAATFPAAAALRIQPVDPTRGLRF